MRLPRMTIKRCLIVVAIIAVGIAIVRPLVGDYCRLWAYYYTAAGNTAMMDAVGFESEASTALKDGDQKRFLSVSQQFAVASADEIYCATQRKRYEKAASLLGMSMENYVPPGMPVPVPIYGPLPREITAGP
jgi:hypothetical protein